MADGTGIEWSDATWNVVTGCTKVSPGCAHCYIDRSPPFRIAGRKFEGGNIPLVFHEDRLEKPLKWKRPRMIFVNSLSDLFHEDISDEFIARVFTTMAAAPQHTFQILTKRPERMRDVVRGLAWEMPGDGSRGEATVYASHYGIPATPLPNVWLGVTIENARFTGRADVLRETPAAVRFISAEPLLSSLFAGPKTDEYGMVACDACERLTKPEILADLCEARSTPGCAMGRPPLDLTNIDWVIAGGESGGRGVRPMRLEWAREIRDACLDTETAFFFKQWGSWEPLIGHVNREDAERLYTLLPGGLEPWNGHRHGSITKWDEPAVDGHGNPIFRFAGVGGKSGGKLLDGREWCEMPEHREPVPA
jgi:protein gp37